MRKKTGIAVLVAACAIALCGPAFGQGEKDGQGQAIVTILPKHDGDPAPSVSAQDMSVKINGKDVKISNLTPLTGTNNRIELVVLIDGSARTSLGRQFEDLQKFVQSLPPNVQVTIGYMENGNTNLSGPFTADRNAALRGLHLPVGTVGSNSSPYFCISDLAKRWPSQDREARREVLMVTDGVDEYNRRYDPEDPYVQAAIKDSVRARMIIYAIYWKDQGRADQTQYADNTGQNLILNVTDATGGKSFWQGLGNPVAFQPFLDDLLRRFKNQYELSFIAPIGNKPDVETFKLKFKAPGSEVDAPQQVFVARPGTAEN